MPSRRRELPTLPSQVGGNSLFGIEVVGGKSKTAHPSRIYKQQYGSFATKKNLVLKTWSGTLKNENTLPDDWINMPGVLVGVEYRKQRGRESTRHGHRVQSLPPVADRPPDVTMFHG